MSDAPATSAPAADAGPLPNAPVPAAAAPAPPAPGHGRWIAAGAMLLVALASAAVVMAWNTQQRLKALEGELVRRQDESAALATESRTLARQAQDVARESSARQALLEARVAESAMQRNQLEDLIQSLARSRDENVLADVETAIRVALQQAAITGSAEPLLLVLKQTDERLARYNQPRLERVRRALAADLDRVKAAGVSDIAVLTIRLDEAVRMVDELPLLVQPERRASAPTGDGAAPAPVAGGVFGGAFGDTFAKSWQPALERVWSDMRALVRVTRIEQPEAMLVAPEQAFFLRENLKLRLLNARLALLSRQFETAQLDLRDVQAALDRYFDRSSRRVVATSELVRQVSAQARMVAVPRPDATLAAIAAASAGR